MYNIVSETISCGTLYNDPLFDISVLLQVEQGGAITPLQTDVRFYTFGHSVNPHNPIGFSALARGRFTTVKCESTIPRRE